MQKNYEIIYLISLKSDKEKAKNKISSLITENGGRVIKEIYFPKEKIAYPIKKEVNGSFLITRFSIPPQNIIKLEKQLRIEKEVLRFLITAVKEIKEKMVMPKKEKKIILKKKSIKEEKIELEEIDKKIDEILKENIA